MQKTALFSLVNFLLGLGYVCGYFASNAILISRVGSDSLFVTYLTGSFAALLFDAIFYFLTDRYPRRRIFQASLLLLSFLTFGIWILLNSGPLADWMYIGIRAFFFAIFVLTELEFWLIASEAFTNFDAKKSFPFFVAAGIIGDIIGGLLVSLTANTFHTINFILVWAVVLFLIPWVAMSGKLWEMPREPESPTNDEIAKDTVPVSNSLPILLFIFWFSFSFFAYGTDYLFNTIAVQNIPQEDSLMAFFGTVTMIANVVVLFYNLFVVPPLTLKLGVSRSLLDIPLLIVTGLAGIYFHPSLLVVALAEGTIFFFSEYRAATLLQPGINLFPNKTRGRMKVLTEGLGRPAGTFLLLLLAFLVPPSSNMAYLRFTLFIAAVLFLGYPFIFRRIYLRHLLSSLKSQDQGLVVNAVQALGERRNQNAVSPLRTLLAQHPDTGLQKSIILSLGHIQSREAMSDIIDLFSVRDESLQITVVQAIANYNNYESILALFRFIKSSENVSSQVRWHVVILLTKLMGKMMVPYLLDDLEDNDLRIKANAIESLGLLHDRNTIPILSPFLKHENHRIRINAAIALYPFRYSREDVREKSLKIIDTFFSSGTRMDSFAAIYAIGTLRLKQYEETLLKLLASQDKQLLHHVTRALAMMQNPRFCSPFLELLLDPDEKFAVNTAKRLGQFPRSSRQLFFEKMATLSDHERQIIFTRLNQTSLDFSDEKKLLTERGILPTPYHL